MLSTSNVISNKISTLASQFNRAIMLYIYDQKPAHLRFMRNLILHNPPNFLKHPYGANHDKLLQFIINCPAKYHSDLPKTADKIRLNLLWNLQHNLPPKVMTELLLSVSPDNKTPFLCAVDANSVPFFQQFILILASTLRFEEIRVQLVQPHLEQTSVLHHIEKTRNVDLLKIYESVMFKYFDVQHARALLEMQANTFDRTGTLPFSTNKTSQTTSPDEYKQTSESLDMRLDIFTMPVGQVDEELQIPQNNNNEECVSYLPPDLFTDQCSEKSTMRLGQ